MFLLILSLFFLRTLLAIPFDDCGFESYPIKVTGVELFKEQHKASFNITVSTSIGLIHKVITGGIVHLQVQYGYKTIMDHTYNLSELITCPVSPGAVVLSFRKQFPYAKELSLHSCWTGVISNNYDGGRLLEFPNLISMDNKTDRLHQNELAPVSALWAVHTLMTPMIYLNLIEEPHEDEIMCLVFCYDTSSSGVVFA
ncbi:hypothetical protein IGI04_034531 [Brassica rapa subsp. trilocularis]|uniref:MD-2-related lipid-recognition domain-containing protein n=1 Tax=Brassica rapa subsp. trilocularis TaxID=1813537 RepID=A0ABQ7LCU2_BRACM|nr:hypothetical protein IGI04_034531 [Brassica rapa subsp. trilocularis]